MAYNLENAV